MMLKSRTRAEVEVLKLPIYLIYYATYSVKGTIKQRTRIAQAL